MNPTLRQMRAFVALARAGNFTLAAQSLHVTQSALSGLIKELEQTLGVRVVDRSTRRIALTATGRELYPLFSQMIDDLDGALANIADQAQLRKGTVRVVAPQLMACTLLPRAIAAWRESHPDIKIVLADSPVEGVIARVQSGEADFGIGPERNGTPELDARELMALPFEAVVPAGHPLAGRSDAGWTELAGHPLITLRGQFTERLLADMGEALRDLTLKPAHEVSYMTTALAMVAAGLGITVCMPYAAPLVRLHGLQTVALAEPVLTRRFFVYTRAQRSPTPAADAFIAFLFEFVGAQADLLRRAPATGSRPPPAKPAGTAPAAAERPR